MNRSNIYFWLFNIITIILAVLFSFGFVYDLHFFMEDQVNLYSFYTGEDRPWPYHKLSLLLYPTHFLFGSNPEGHFALVLLLYVALCITLSIFVWKITNNKAAAFLASILLAVGGTGSQMLFMVETGWNSLYLILLLITLLIYNAYLYSHKIHYYLISITLFSLALFLLPYRAFSFIGLIFISSLFLQATTLKNRILHSLINCFPFLTIHFIFYLFVPNYFYKIQSGDGLFTSIIETYNLTFTLNLLADLGNFIIPSIFTEKASLFLEHKHNVIFYIFMVSSSISFFAWLFLKNKVRTFRRNFLFATLNFSFIALSFYIFRDVRYLMVERYLGLLLIFTLINLLFFLESNLKFKKNLAYLALGLLVSYAFFHFKEPNLVHQSWSRYIMHAYPIYITLLSYILVRLFIQSKSSSLKTIGYLTFVFLIIVNLLANFWSPLKTELLTRSSYLKEFNLSLKEQVPILDKNNKYLFYFDVSSDLYSQKLFGSFFATGSGSEEMILANAYGLTKDQFKIVDNYDAFIAELKEQDYADSFSFFYNTEKQLLKISPHSSETRSIKIDLSTVVTDDSEGTDQQVNNNLIAGGILEYRSTIDLSDSGSSSANGSIKIPGLIFPSNKPVFLNISVRANPLTSLISKFPYRHESPFESPPVESYLSDLHNDQKRSELLQFITDRKDLKDGILITSSGDENSQKVGNIIDSDLNTAWQANKEAWFNHQPTWIEAEFPVEKSIGEIRWISRREYALPTNYQYQAYYANDNSWKILHSATNQEVTPNSTVIDSFPHVYTKKLRMIITKTKGGDIPTLSEIEFMPKPFKVSSEHANFLIKYPFAEIKNELELNQIFDTILEQQYISVYPISDKYQARNLSTPTIQTFNLNGQENEYTFLLPAGGTKLTDLYIELPNIPISAQITSMTLSN